MGRARVLVRQTHRCWSAAGDSASEIRSPLHAIEAARVESAPLPWLSIPAPASICPPVRWPEQPPNSKLTCLEGERVRPRHLPLPTLPRVRSEFPGERPADSAEPG